MRNFRLNVKNYFSVDLILSYTLKYKTQQCCNASSFQMSPIIKCLYKQTRKLKNDRYMSIDGI